MLQNILNTFANCFKIPELKSRILFTLIVLAICRVVAMIPIPGLDGAALAQFFDEQRHATGGGGLLGMYSMFTGGALEHCAVGALGIMPYISATIIIQLLTAVVPQLEQAGPRRRRADEDHPIWPLPDRAALSRPGVGDGHGLGERAEHLSRISQASWCCMTTASGGIASRRVIILTTGTHAADVAGEQITERGIGNGISLVITHRHSGAAAPGRRRRLLDMFSPGGGRRRQVQPLPRASPWSCCWWA